MLTSIYTSLPDDPIVANPTAFENDDDDDENDFLDTVARLRAAALQGEDMGLPSGDIRSGAPSGRSSLSLHHQLLAGGGPPASSAASAALPVTLAAQQPPLNVLASRLYATTYDSRGCSPGGTPRLSLDSHSVNIRPTDFM